MEHRILRAVSDNELLASLKKLDQSANALQQIREIYREELERRGIEVKREEN